MRTATRLLPVFAFISGCAIGGDNDDPSIESALSGTASISLTGSSVNVTQTSDTSWTLDKNGSLSGNTVSWNITATKGATVGGRLVLQGQMTVTNTGSGPATIGNIVVNLQKRVSNTWVSASVDIADATSGDAATTAKIHKQASSEGKSSFSENAASGELEFMDATNNTIFSLVPQVLVGPGQTRSLLFQAWFDNNALGLTAGTSIRSEVIVSFGNATVSGNSTANIDINGNGSIDSDEARIRSVPTRLTVAVPAPTNGNSNVTLTDTAGDVAATGTVTFSNLSINLGATTGTVTATVDGGTDGGTITNCAHLTSPDQTVTSGGFTFTTLDGLDLDACSTVSVGATTCTPGAAGCGWKEGDMLTYAQGDWGADTGAAATLLVANFETLYFSMGGLVEVGSPGAGGFSMRFTDSTSIQLYLPASGSVASLNADLVNPTASASGVFGGDVLALQLNVDFSAAGLLAGVSDVGDLNVCGVPGLPNMSVSSFLAVANTLLGGGSGFSLSDVAPVTTSLNVGFLAAAPSTFVQEHVFNGPCP